MARLTPHTISLYKPVGMASIIKVFLNIAIITTQSNIQYVGVLAIVLKFRFIFNAWW